MQLIYYIIKLKMLSADSFDQMVAMESCKLYWITFALLAATVLVAQAEVDCNERPPFVHREECCAAPNAFAEDIKEKCSKKFSKHEGDAVPNKEHPHFRHHPCFHACVLNETKIMVDGEFSETNMNKYLEAALGTSSEILPVLRDAFPHCYEKAKTIMEHIRADGENNVGPSNGQGPPHHHHHHRHHPHHHHHHHPHHCQLEKITMMCTMTKVFMECPEEIWSDTDECNQNREYVQTCFQPREENEEDIEEEDIEEEEDIAEEDIEEEIAEE